MTETTQEQFDALVAKLESFSKRNPGGYRLRVALFALLGYAYIFFILTGLLALVGLIVALLIFNQRLNSLMIRLVIMLLIPAWIIVRSLWVTFPPPEGLKLSRRQFPRLFALVDELTTKLKAPRFHHILLEQDFNAAVYQHPRLGILGWYENYLFLGLPLMQSFSLEQLEAVLAHELGHLSGNHSRFDAWIYRIRKIWMQMNERLHQNDQGRVSFLFNRFFDWYWPSFNVYSFTLARMNEYEADRCSVQLAGARNTAEALINTKIKARFLEYSFWSDIETQTAYQPDPPDNVYSSMLTALSDPIDEEKSNQWLEEALSEETNNLDTHPCLTERLQALGYLTSHNPNLPQLETITTSAAEYLLGNQLQQLAAKFDLEWKESASTSWRQRYGYIQERQSKLDVLEQKAQEQPLEVDEAWERAYYTLELQGYDDAIPLIQDVLKIQPDHAAANYTFGEILLYKADETGIAYLEKAIAQRTDWVIEGCQLIYGFLYQNGQIEEAQKYLERAKQHHQLLQKAQEERDTLTDEDKFKPHTLQASEVRELKQQLETYSEIKEAYLVEKVVKYFPEDRLCILGIVRNQKFLENENAAQNFLDQTISNLDFLVPTYTIVLNHISSGNFKKKICKINRSLILKR